MESRPTPSATQQHHARHDPFEPDGDYFSRRSREENAAAEHASCPQSRTAHLELASRYALLAAAIREASGKLG
ncbi:hypothetical protein [Sphingomonas arenae]|uniref:hypothetical protein n=1 Tax=Sphingomonas arenae TaxID=2812555 RepID=UPI001966D852|nr:hypothetical protein [Sphingomonas arenae]